MRKRKIFDQIRRPEWWNVYVKRKKNRMPFSGTKKLIYFTSAFHSVILKARTKGASIHFAHTARQTALEQGTNQSAMRKGN